MTRHVATELRETSTTILEHTIEAERQRFGVPGVAVAVVRGDEVLVSRGFGERNTAEGLPVTDRTLFAIASSTKAFTAGLVGALVDDGLIEWDRPVRHYLPQLRLHGQPALSVEFMLDGSGAATSAVVDPVGIFVRNDGAD
jgi:CubicO group peptidase (beta-lactamase class C family)